MRQGTGNVPGIKILVKALEKHQGTRNESRHEKGANEYELEEFEPNTSRH